MDSGFDTFSGTRSAIASALVEELVRGVALIGRIDDESYTEKSKASGSVGEHFRHNLNFVEAVLKGAKLGRIDYAKRERDCRIEVDRRYAAQRFEAVVAALSRMRASDVGTEVSVVSEVNPSVAYRSSVGRELEFAHSHTVHHHALIAEKLRGMGVEVDVLFGVAPSTVRYWNARDGSN